MLSLASMPETGHRREELTDDETIRFWSVGSYLIVFRVNTRPLEVIRTLHGARDMASELRSRGELGKVSAPSAKPPTAKHGFAPSSTAGVEQRSSRLSTGLHSYLPYHRSRRPSPRLTQRPRDQ